VRRRCRGLAADAGPEHGIEPFERKAVPGADGYWSVRDVSIPFAGRWHLRVDALVTDFERIALEHEFVVPARLRGG